MPEPAPPLQYALVAYLRNPVGRFVEELRREIYPEHHHLPAHITVLPPRCLSGTEPEAMAALGEQIPRLAAFEVTLGEVDSFIPRTPTVFLRVDQCAERFHELHVSLNQGPACCTEKWPYQPHLTIVKMPEFHQVERALDVSRQRWTGYRGERTAWIEELTFVREGVRDHWVDLMSVKLGSANRG